jgi:hypothetical protein
MYSCTVKMSLLQSLLIFVATNYKHCAPPKRVPGFV